METETTLKRFVLSDNKRRILVAIAQAPRTVRSFTHGDFMAQMNPDVIQGWLTEMETHGLVYSAESTYHITVKGRQKLDSNAEEYRTAALRNVTSSGTYTGEPRDYQRPNSCTKHIPSKGTPC